MNSSAAKPLFFTDPMPYLVTIHDRPDREHLRAANEADHYAYLEANRQFILLRGGLQGPDGGFVGGVLLLDVPSEAAARNLLARDPYAQAGLQAEVHVQRFAPAWCAPAERWK